MAYNTKNDTITVSNVEYDIVQSHDRIDGSDIFTVELDDEPVFDGLEGRIRLDEDARDLSPRENESNVGVIAVSYRGYDLGDEDISEIDFIITCNRCGGNGYREFRVPLLVKEGTGTIEVRCAKCNGVGDVSLNPIDYFRKERGARVVLPLTVYEHSGVTMQVGHVGDHPFDSAGWDTSFVGFIFDTPDTLKETMGDNVTNEQIEKALRSEVARYASYLEGDVTYYTVDDHETNYSDSCSGFIGDHDGIKEALFDAMDSAIEKRIRESIEREHWAARDTITV